MPSDKIGKKRKRASDRHERPSKKPALQLQALPPLAASLVEDKSELAPVIGEFTSAAIASFLRY
jgi:DNA-directed RNA polymerase I subunit RPA49